MGQEIHTLVDELHPAGSHQFIWNGKDQFGRTVPSGLYFYQLEVNGFVDGKKMLMLK